MLIDIFCEIDDFCKYFEKEWIKAFYAQSCSSPIVSREIISCQHGRLKKARCNERKGSIEPT